MVRVPKRLAVVAAVSAAAAVGLSGPAAPVPALAPAAAVAADKPGPVDRAVRRLQAAQNKDGGFGTTPGGPSDPETSVWATLALASIGINPTDQPDVGTTAFEYVLGGTTGWRRYKTTSALAGYVLVLRAAGTVAESARVVAIGALLERATPGGGFPETDGGPAELRATALATLALQNDPAQFRMRSTTAQAITKAAEWMKGAFSNTGWGATARARPRPDTTGLALQALFAIDRDDPKTRDLADRVTPWLNQNVNEDGGLGASRLDESDPTATARVMQGLLASGQDPRRFATGLDNRTPKDYLVKRQADDGGFGDTLTTAQILPGFAAKGFPTDAVALGSPMASRKSWSDRAKNGAGTGGKGGADALSGADAGSDGSGDGDKDTDDDQGGGTGGTGGGTTSGDSSGGGTPAASTPSATPPAATPAPAPTPTPTPAAPTPTTETTPKPADDTVAAAGDGDDEDDDPAGGPTQQVNGVVVGAQAAAASKAPGIAAGAGDAGDRGAAVLGGLIVALVLVGTQLERRRPRRIVS